MNRWKIVFMHGSFLFMFIMAAHFYKERLFADSAYYIFNTIDTGFFVTANQRIVLAISEIVPLLFFYAGASLKVILLSWSLGHVLFYYSLFLVALYKFKSEKAAIAIILLQVIGQTWLYYSPMLEICYGASLLVIFKLLLDSLQIDDTNHKSEIVNRKSLIWLVVLEILVLTSHPENFVAFFFVIGVDVLKNGFKKSRHPVFLFVFIATIVFKFLNLSEYEGGKINYMTNFHENHQFENLWKPDYLRDVWKIFKDHYIDLLILCGLTCAYLIYKKSFSLLLFFVAVIIGLLALINATNYAREFTRYNESLYYPLVTITVIAFMFEVYHESQHVGIRQAIFLVLIIFIYRFGQIKTQGDYLSCRIFQLEEIIRQAHEQKISKGLIKVENSETERWPLNWSYPIESLLLSSVNNRDSTVSVISDEDFDNRDTTVQLTPNRLMVRRWEIREQDKMLAFFKLKEEKYKLLNNIDTITKPEELSVNLSVDTSKYFIAYKKLFITLKINNSSRKIISSLPVEKCFLKISCTSGGNKYESKIPLDIDIHSSYSEIVSCPINNIPKASSLDFDVRLIWMDKEISNTKAVIRATSR